LTVHTKIVTSCIILTAACSIDLPPPYLVDKLRVLAVRATPPEVAPGGTTALDLLIADPQVPPFAGGAPASASALWFACAAPPASAIPGPCSPDSAKNFGNQPTEQYTVPTHAMGDQLLTVIVADANESASSCASDLIDRGYLTQPDHCVVAIKRLAVSPTPVHTNPALEAFTLNGITIKNSGLALPIQPAATSYKLDATRSASTTGSLNLSWYATAGSLDDRISNFAAPNMDVSTNWHPPAGGASVRFWAVIRDDQGGVGFLPDQP
jgi:hypothetical protein